jgi:hypothetical protein
MEKKPKPEEKIDREDEKTVENESESEVVKDQTERGYYYDDACGYEVYVEEDED